MSHSFNKIWIHAIWSTKERLPLIHPTIESKLYNFIWQTQDMPLIQFLSL